jgi:galactose mutarotase-like enzyme
MQQQGQLVTLREGSEAKALIAPDLGGWLLRYTRHLPRHGYVDALHFSQEVVDRYPNKMYAGNPLLFPMVSFNSAAGREHHYEWQGRRFPMPQHGFARRQRWKTLRVSESSLLLELTDNPQTAQDYPFQFALRLLYELQEGRLLFRQTVENRSSVVMPFSTGIHPYFRVPLSAEGSRDRCYVELPAARRIHPHDHWTSWTAESCPARHLPVSEDVSGTLFLTDLAVPRVRLVDPNSRLSVTLDLSEAPAHRYIAFWAESTAQPYYCIEPWTALPNSFARQQTELTLLQPGEIFTAGLSLELEEDRV